MKNKTLQIKIIVRLLRLVFNKDVYFIARSYIDLFEKLRKKSGLRYAISYMKAVRLHVTRYICGKPLFSNSAGVAINRSGLPKRLHFIKGYLDSGDVSVILSLLTYTRSVTPRKDEAAKLKPDYSSITDPFIGREGFTIPASFIKEWVKVNNLRLARPEHSSADHYVSTKSSPNGLATMSSLWAPRVLSGDLIRAMMKIISKSAKVMLVQAISLGRFIEWSPYGLEIKDHHQCTGRLAIVKDPELKLRVIAMVDYLSQFILKPIHEDLLYLLSTLSQDRTYTQDPHNSWSESGGANFYSLDLSSATDRFPLVLQKKLISYIYDDFDFAQGWANLLIKRGYVTPEGVSLNYSVGQPMGAYSSWAAFTITHHLVVAWAAHKSGYSLLSGFKDYIILGDDIVIKNDRVASNYIAIMTKLGVKISVPKTHVSKDTYEFAKRWIRGGKEITGIPLKGVLGHWKNVLVVYLELFNYFQKRPINRMPTLDLACLLYKGLPIKGGRIKSAHSIRRLLYDFNQALRYNFGLATYDELRSYWAAKTRNHISMVPGKRILPSLLKATLSTALVKEVAKSRLETAYSIRSFNGYFGNLVRDQRLPYLKELIQQFALFHAYKNHVQEAKAALDAWLKDNLSFEDVIMKMRIESFDKIAYMYRNKAARVALMSKTWSNSFSLLFNKDQKAYVKFSADVRQMQREAASVNRREK